MFWLATTRRHEQADLVVIMEPAHSQTRRGELEAGVGSLLVASHAVCIRFDRDPPEEA